MILEIQSILYATDLSKNSAYAFLYATDLSEYNKARIHIIHVIEELPPSVKAMVEGYLTPEQMENLSHQKSNTVEKIRNRLHLFCENFQKGDPQCELRVASIDISEGYPANEILKKANEKNCDLIVMGTHGKGVISHAFLGSVAEKVLRRTKIPVFVIPLPEDEQGLGFQDF
ncbi:MAG: universal stress protein [Deltaproteobacteria bacterium]|nr:universal stress protein [Deltaproteobacteria bacterium]